MQISPCSKDLISPILINGKTENIEAIGNREIIEPEVYKEVIKYAKGDLSRNVGCFNLKD